MFDWIRQRVLHFLRVPHDPAPPFGAPGSVRVFRAARNYYNLRLVRWGFGQVGALIGIVVSLTFLTWFKGEIDAFRTAQAAIQMTMAATYRMAMKIIEFLFL